MADAGHYDEFGMLAENAAEAGYHGRLPHGVRVNCGLPDGTSLSAIKWGEDPAIVFLHGGGQNAHTWDTVVVALGRSALAVDLPGHGHSDWRADRDYWPVRNADAVSRIIREHIPNPVAVVGMSLGGLTTIRLAAKYPELVSRAVVIDVTPSVFERQVAMTREQKGTTALITGPRVYADLDAMIASTAGSAPQRSAASIRRGVLHNSRVGADGRWTWRYDALDTSAGELDFGPLWNDLAATTAPVALVSGGDSVFVADDDRAAFRRHRPDATVVTIPGAGHSVQSDQPVPLAQFLQYFLFESGR